jgi:hypothetical protein
MVVLQGFVGAGADAAVIMVQYEKVSSSSPIHGDLILHVRSFVFLSSSDLFSDFPNTTARVR